MKTEAGLAPVSWHRMIRAVEKVRDRMLRAVRALEAAKVPYAVAGGNAVAAWVSRVDETAARNITKVVENIICNCLHLRQNFLRFPRLSETFDIGGAVGLINKFRPRILHLHFSQIDSTFFSGLAYRPTVIVTVHGMEKCTFSDHADVLVCIHRPAFNLNEGRRLIIENTVWVDPRDKREVSGNAGLSQYRIINKSSWQTITQFSGDNTNGNGATPVSWNLQ